MYSQESLDQALTCLYLFDACFTLVQNMAITQFVYKYIQTALGQAGTVIGNTLLFSKLTECWFILLFYHSISKSMVDHFDWYRFGSIHYFLYWMFDDKIALQSTLNIIWCWINRIFINKQLLQLKVDWLDYFDVIERRIRDWMDKRCTNALWEPHWIVLAISHMRLLS